MAVWECLNCAALYGVALFRCPRCQTDEQPFMESEMPKITKARGATDESVVPEGDDQQWDGSNSSQSTKKQENSQDSPTPENGSTAQTTELPSTPEQTGNGSADSTAGKKTKIKRR